MPAPSYSHGVSDVRLLGETIGATSSAPRRGSPSARRWSRPPPGRAAHLRRARRGGRPRRRAACWPPGSRRATASGSGRRTAPSGCSCSTRPPRPARSSSTSTPPTARTSWRTRCASRACRLLVSRAGVQDAATTLAMVEEVRGELPGAASASCSSTRAEWDELLAATPVDARRARRARRRRSRSTTRSTSSTRAARRASPRARRSRHHNILNNGFFVGRAAAATPRPTASACRCRSTTASAWSWATSARDDPRRVHRHPGGRRSSPRATLRPCRPSAARALYGVPTMFIAELGHAELRRATT